MTSHNALKLAVRCDDISLRDLQGPPPMSAIDVEPDDLSSSLQQGELETRQLMILNLGGETLDWQVTEAGGQQMKIGLREPDCTLPDRVCVAPENGSVPGDSDQVVDVTFDATGPEPGTYEATVCLGSNDPERPLTAVPLALTVLEAKAPVLVFDPARFEFGDVEVGATSEARTATRHNSGNAAATNLVFSSPDDGFLADTNACGTTLSAAASCDCSVTFTPAEEASAELGLIGNGVSDGGFTPVALEVDLEAHASDGDGVFEPGELVDVAATWRSNRLADTPLTATASNFTGPEGADYSLAQDTADYGTVGPGETATCRDVGLRLHDLRTLALWTLSASAHDPTRGCRLTAPRGPAIVTGRAGRGRNRVPDPARPAPGHGAGRGRSRSAGVTARRGRGRTSW